MKVIAPIAMTDAQLAASNVSEDDYPEWDASTTYSAGDSVIVLSAHKVYESVQGSNLDNDPTTDDGTWWTEVGATNRWRAFDGVIGSKTSRSGTISYEIEPARLTTGLAFFGLSAAQIRVQVEDDGSPATETYDKTMNLVDDSDIVDWFTFFTTDLDQFQTEALFTGVPGYAGHRITITIGDGTGTAEVGEIAFGRVAALGDTLEGTEIGLRSFSTKEQDSFGNWNIVSRAKSDPVDFTFAMSAADAGRVKRVLTSLRDTPAVYFADESLTKYGAITYGLFQDYTIPLVNRGFSIVNLEIEGLT